MCSYITPVKEWVPLEADLETKIQVLLPGRGSQEPEEGSGREEVSRVHATQRPPLRAAGASSHGDPRESMWNSAVTPAACEVARGRVLQLGQSLPVCLAGQQALWPRENSEADLQGSAVGRGAGGK